MRVPLTIADHLWPMWDQRKQAFHDKAGRTVVVRQVVGILARRIVCRVVEGQQLDRGRVTSRLPLMTRAEMQELLDRIQRETVVPFSSGVDQP